MKSKMTQEEYQSLKLFLKIYSDQYLVPNIVGLLPEEHPIAVLESFEKKSMAQARKGLEITINDIVEDTSDWRPQRVIAVDAELRSHGAMTLTEARRRYSGKYDRILKRGRIVGDEECYLIKGMVDDCTLEFGSPEREKIEAMLTEYENKVVERLKKTRGPEGQ